MKKINVTLKQEENTVKKILFLEEKYLQGQKVDVLPDDCLDYLVLNDILSEVKNGELKVIKN